MKSESTSKDVTDTTKVPVDTTETIADTTDKTNILEFEDIEELSVNISADGVTSSNADVNLFIYLGFDIPFQLPAIVKIIFGNHAQPKGAAARMFIELDLIH